MKYTIPLIEERLKNIRGLSVEKKQVDYFISELNKLFSTKKNVNILHLGSSSGFWDYLILKNFHKKINFFHSADIGKTAVKKNDLFKLKNYNKWFYFPQQKERKFKLPKQAKYDFIIHHDTIEHVEKFNLYLLETKKKLKKKGTLFFSTPNLLRLSNIIKLMINQLHFPFFMDGKGSKEHGPSIHHQEFTKFQLELLLKEYNFKNVEIEYKFFNIPLINISFDLKDNALSHLLFVKATN